MGEFLWLESLQNWIQSLLWCEPKGLFGLWSQNRRSWWTTCNVKALWQDISGARWTSPLGKIVLLTDSRAQSLLPFHNMGFTIRSVAELSYHTTTSGSYSSENKKDYPNMVFGAIQIMLSFYCHVYLTLLVMTHGSWKIKLVTKTTQNVYHYYNPINTFLQIGYIIK